MSGGEWLAIAVIASLVGGLVYMLARFVLIFRKGDEVVSGGSWGRQLFGRRQDS